MSPQTIGTIALAALVATAPLRAQQVTSATTASEGRVLGTVLDENENPVAGALVILGDGRSTETDASGRFMFLRVRAGAHEIAAVSPSCEVAAGGFDVQSGADARLQLVVELMPQPGKEARRSRGTATRALNRQELTELGNRSALDALIQLAPNHFEVQGHRLALRARRGTGSLDVIEPLLVVDGVRVPGLVAESLRNVRAGDLSRMEVHLGSAAGWEFQNGGAPAVIEITMRVHSGDPVKNPEICLGRGAR
jgi:hypothetical protein